MSYGKITGTFVVLLFLTSLIALAYAGVTFDIERKNISNDLSNSKAPEIFTKGNDVYLVWYDTDNKIRFANSTNNGVAFDTAIDLGITNTGGTSATAPDPQIIVNNNNLFLVWHDGTNIKFINSTNNGDTFNSEINLGSVGSTTKLARPQITNASGNNVYVTWADNSGDVRFINSTNTVGVTFPFSAADIGNVNTGGVVAKPRTQIASSGNNVYVLWTDGSNIKIINSTNNGDTFNSEINLGSYDVCAGVCPADAAPDLVVNGTKIYAVWRNSSTVQFVNSTSNSEFKYASTSLGTSVDNDNDGATPKIAVGSGGNVYVVWNDNDVIKFKRSTNSGDTFESEQTISATSTAKRSQPHIATANNLVYVVWKEGISGANDQDIIFKSSSNNGTSFDSQVNLNSAGTSDDDQFSEVPKISATNGKAYFTWAQKSTSSATDGEIKFSSGTGTAISIALNQTQYRLSDTALITVVDTSASSNSTAGIDQISIRVTSTSDSTGLSITLTETSGKSAKFTGTMTFTTGTSSGTSLKAAAGNTITGTFSGVTGSSSIHPITIGWNGNPNLTSLIISDIPYIRITDQNSNKTSSVETITVSISSASGTSGTDNPVSVTLTETGGKTGIFGGADDNSVIFMNNHSTFQIDKPITITQNNVTNTNSGVIDSASFTVKSDTFPAGGTITLTETGENTGVFSGTLTFISGTTSSNSIQATPGDYVSIVKSSTNGAQSITERSLITPNTNSSRTAVRISANSGASDTVTATFGGKSASLSVSVESGESGGGGGGLVRPTIVVNALAALPIFGGGGNSDTTAPIATLDSITKLTSVTVPDNIKKIIEDQKPNVPIEPMENEPFDLPLSINEKGYPLGSDENTIVTNNLNVGQTVKFKTVFYEQTDLEHVSMYMNIRDGQRDDKSDTYILFNKRSPLEIIDRNGFFENVKFEIIVDKHNKKTAVFEITFAKPMETSDLIYKSWDFERRGTTVQVRDAINIELPPSEKIEENIPPEPVNTKSLVPDWIKNNVGWWADGQIDDKTFTNGIGFLISEKILDVPVGPNVSKIKTDDPEIVEEEPKESTVPDWVKNNAKWWAAGQIDEDTFLSGIEYLVKHEIIIVSNS